MADVSSDLESSAPSRYVRAVAWLEKRLRGTRVWMQSDDTGRPLTGPDDRVEIVYKLGGKPYRAAARNLDAVADAVPVADGTIPADAPRPKATATAGKGEGAAVKPRARKSSTPAADAVHVYTDGACTGNPGPMGIGVVILDPLSTVKTSSRREISEYLGRGTNNIAELTAIERGLDAVDRARPVVIYSDSSYSIGVLSQGWRAKANQELVARLRSLVQQFPSVSFVKVAGHAGIPENERCDALARVAIETRSARRG